MGGGGVGSSDFERFEGCCNFLEFCRLCKAYLGLIIYLLNFNDISFLVFSQHCVNV